VLRADLAFGVQRAVMAVGVSISKGETVIASSVLPETAARIWNRNHSQCAIATGERRLCDESCGGTAVAVILEDERLSWVCSTRLERDETGDFRLA